jgi:hypothetical protein
MGHALTVIVTGTVLAQPSTDEPTLVSVEGGKVRGTSETCCVRRPPCMGPKADTPSPKVPLTTGYLSSKVVLVQGYGLLVTVWSACATAGIPLRDLADSADQLTSCCVLLAVGWQ